MKMPEGTRTVGSARAATRRRRHVALALAAALMSAAGASSAAAQEAAGTTLRRAPVSPVPATITRADVDKAVDALDGIVENVMAETGVPGIAVAVVHEDEVLYEKGFGVREVGADAPVDTDTVFLIASLSKPIASTVIAGLAGRGDLAFDDPVVHSLETFALGDPYVTRHATFADLLSHRSGLHTGAGDLLEDLGFDRETILARLHLQPLDSFRSSYNYSNFGFTSAGEAAARAAGQPWEAVAEEVLFEPLGMARTSYRHADYLAHDNRAHIHVRTSPDGTTWAALNERNPDAEAPAGGASASIADMAKFMRLQLGEGMFEGQQVVDEAALRVTHLPHSLSGPASDTASRSRFYGLGWGVAYDDEGRVELSHSGAFNAGTATNVMLLPGEELGIAVLSNGEPIGAPETIASIFMEIARHGEQTVDWLPLLGHAFAQMRAADIADAAAADPAGDPGPDRPLEAYTGSYDNDYYGPATVTAADDGLTMTLGPRSAPVVFALRRVEGGRFVFDTIGEWATGPSHAQFSGDADGKATSLTLGAYDIRGLGTFERK